jgi:hypothetical protein
MLIITEPLSRVKAKPATQVNNDDERSAQVGDYHPDDDGSDGQNFDDQGIYDGLEEDSGSLLGKKRATDKYKDSFKYQIGIDENLPPISTNSDIFRDMTGRAYNLGDSNALNHLNGRPINVATMCSGTESPILALQLFSKCKSTIPIYKPHRSELIFADLKELFGLTLKFNHLFSAEIVPRKQSYIESNFHPPVIFRDIKELSLSNPDPSKPRTA